MTEPWTSQTIRPDTARNPQAVLQLIQVVPLTLELGSALTVLADPGLGGDLMDQVVSMRQAIALESGFVTPGVQIRDNPALPPEDYQILCRNQPVARGTLFPGRQLAVMHAYSDAATELPGILTVEPAGGRRAYWVARDEAEAAIARDYTVLSASQALVAHLDEVVRQHAHEILSMDELQIMLDHLAQAMPRTVAAVVPEKLDLAGYHWLLKGLLRERVSIRDQATILETVAHTFRPEPAIAPVQLNVYIDGLQQLIEPKLDPSVGATTGATPRLTPEMLLEKVRAGLARQICAELASDTGVLDVILFDRRTQQMLLDLLDESSEGECIQLLPPMWEQLTKKLLGASERSGAQVLLVDKRLRPHVKRLIARNLPKLAVISYAEVHPEYRFHAVESVALVEN